MCFVKRPAVAVISRARHPYSPAQTKSEYPPPGPHPYTSNDPELYPHLLSLLNVLLVDTLNTSEYKNYPCQCKLYYSTNNFTLLYTLLILQLFSSFFDVARFQGLQLGVVYQVTLSEMTNDEDTILLTSLQFKFCEFEIKFNK